MTTPAIIIVLVVLAVCWDGFCLRDLARARRVRYLPKWVWAIVCLLSCPWGGILYMILGREPADHRSFRSPPG
jgi:hypothetical protein